MTNMKQKGKQKTVSQAGALLVIAIIAMLSLTVVAAAQPAQGSGSLALLQYTLPILPTTWISIALAAVLTIIAIAVVVYMLAGVINSQNAKGWARFQIYEGLLSVLLAVIFISFVYLFFVNPGPALQSVNLLPGPTQYTQEMNCQYNAATNPAGPTDMFSIATCNVAVFNHFAFGLFEAIYFVTNYLGFVPGFSVSAALNIQNTKTSTSAGLTPSIVPFSPEYQLSYLFSGLLILILLNEVQAILLSGSLMWLAFFISIGLIARSFGFSRTFGGAMIAMGLGLGLVYPLVVNITYGFVNVIIANSADSTAACIGLSMLYSFITIIFGQGVSTTSVCPTSMGGDWLFPLGVAIAGLTFLPFLNFTIVDSFIVDFSSAIGERVNFMSLLVGLI